jgi:helicase
MKVETLEAYNVPSEILAIWRSQVGADLLPVQERAVKEFGLFSEGNLIVFSPTSSGKTFIGEMAAVKAARGNTKVFYNAQRGVTTNPAPNAALTPGR